MTSYTPSQIFGQLTKSSEGVKRAEVTTLKNTLQRLITLHEYGEASSPPDRIKCVLSCFHTKKTADEVKTSTNKRVDYIIQTLRNNGLKEGHYDVHKLMTLMDDGHYNMKAEICVTFTSVSTYEKTVNFLIEKLEASIRVSEPIFYVSSEKVGDLRRHACLNAVKNCRTKALSIAQYLNQTLGPALTIREEDTSEYVGSPRAQDSLNSGAGVVHVNSDDRDDDIVMRLSIQQKISDATVTIRVKIFAEFECNERIKKTLGK